MFILNEANTHIKNITEEISLFKRKIQGPCITKSYKVQGKITSLKS